MSTSSKFSTIFASMLQCAFVRDTCCPKWIERPLAEEKEGNVCRNGLTHFLFFCCPLNGGGGEEHNPRSQPKHHVRLDVTGPIKS